jgi:hypothetical protein
MGSPIRLAVTGPNASGKTTLARAIAEKYSIPFLGEDINSVFGAQMDFYRLRRENRPQGDVDAAMEKWKNSFFEWAVKREQAYAMHESFVADRWEVDLLDTWLVLMRTQEGTDRGALALIQFLRRSAARLHFAILTPFEKPLGGSSNKEGLGRALGFSNRLLNSMVTTGIVHSVKNLRVLRIPEGPLPLDARLDLVDRALARLDESKTGSVN